MRHDIHAEGFNLRVRPVRLEDAAFIVWLRNLDYVKGNVGDSAPDVPSQEAWLRQYFEKENDYYFIVETSRGISVGTHGIYNVSGTTAENGRHIMRAEVMAGLPSGILTADLAFGRMGLRELWAWVVAGNRAVESIHRKSGFRRVKVAPAAQVIGGKHVDLIEYRITAEDWFRVRERQLPLGRVAAAQVLDWEQTQLHKLQPWEDPADTEFLTSATYAE